MVIHHFYRCVLAVFVFACFNIALAEEVISSPTAGFRVEDLVRAEKYWPTANITGRN